MRSADSEIVTRRSRGRVVNHDFRAASIGFVGFVFVFRFLRDSCEG